MQAAVHPGHLKLVLEIRNGAQAAQDDAGVAFAQKIHQQTVEADDLDVGHVLAERLRHLDALGERKDRSLAVTLGDTDDDMGEQACGAAHQIFMSPREGIEGARIDGDAVVHSCPSK